jgi:hypothetical protein
LPDYDSSTDTISASGYQTENDLNVSMDTPLCSVDDSHSELFIIANKRKKSSARNVSEVRRSNRLAGLSAGFKGKDAADKAAGKDAKKGKVLTNKISKNTKKTTKKKSECVLHC